MNYLVALRLHLSFPTRRSSDLESERVQVRRDGEARGVRRVLARLQHREDARHARRERPELDGAAFRRRRSEEHTSELQSPCNIVCRLLLEQKKNLPYS